MEIKDIVFEPHSDMSAYDIDLVRQHDELIKQDSYDNATALLNNSNYNKGFRASLLNSFQNKLRKFEEFLLNEFVADDDTYYSYDEPTIEFMEENNYTWWIQPY